MLIPAYLVFGEVKKESILHKTEVLQNQERALERRD